MKHFAFRLPFTLSSIGLIVFGVLLFSDVMALSREASLKDLIERSDLVISGTVVNKSMAQESVLADITSPDADGNYVTRVLTVNKVLTEYEIELIDVIKGCYEKTSIPVTVRGGVVGNKEYSTSHTFYLAEGKKYYFFLSYEQRNNKYWAVSSQQGVFEEVETNGEVVIKSINRATVLSTDDKFIPGTKSSEKGSLKVEQFISRVKETCHE